MSGCAYLNSGLALKILLKHLLSIKFKDKVELLHHFLNHIIYKYWIFIFYRHICTQVNHTYEIYYQLSEIESEGIFIVFCICNSKFSLSIPPPPKNPRRKIQD